MKLRIKPGDKVIMFLPSRDPCIGWICSDHLGRSIFPDARIAKTTCYHDEALEGKGRFVSVKHLQPYDDYLWAACEEWKCRRSDNDEELNRLKKGKIPKNYNVEFKISVGGE